MTVPLTPESVAAYLDRRIRLYRRLYEYGTTPLARGSGELCLACYQDVRQELLGARLAPDDDGPPQPYNAPIFPAAPVEECHE